MLFAKGSNAILRKGVIIKGGTSFEILESEVEDFKERGFDIEGEASPETPESGNINMSSEENPGGKSENIVEEIQASVAETPEEGPKVLSGGKASPETPKMGKSPAKATSTSKVSAVKKG